VQELLGGLLTLLQIPIISIIGYKDSGKTLVAEHLTRFLTTKGLQVLSAKHVGKPDFTLDHPGTDSYRHIQAGAKAVFLQSDNSTSLLFASHAPNLSELIRRSQGTFPVDVMVMEGFKRWTSVDPSIAKIICLRFSEELVELTRKLKGPVLAKCSLNLEVENIIKIPEKLPIIARATYTWFQNQEKEK
jgi:molybdopterin-guanine dinucleotide biosynthesis protein B